MSRKSFNPQECISQLNNVKAALQAAGKPFNSKTILESLKNCGLPSNATFWKVFRKSGILQEVSRGLYMFTSKEPIYVGALYTIKKKYAELAKHYSTKKPIETEEESKEVIVPQEIEPENTVEIAIRLLKEHGYKVYAPIGTLYQEI